MIECLGLTILLQLYRDCMRMADWIASKVRVEESRASRICNTLAVFVSMWVEFECMQNGAQGAMIRQQIRQAFVSKKHLTNPEEV